jgi:hypothetical protein
VQLDSLKELYASKTDDELLSLAAERNSLVEMARLALADELRRRSLDDLPVPEPIPPLPAESKSQPDHKTPSPSRILWLGLFLLDTFLVYQCAWRVPPMLVRMWFAWFAPIFGTPANVAPVDWHLRHLALMTIIISLIAGYIDVARFLPAIVGKQIAGRRSSSAGTWMWIIPTTVLLYCMLQFRASSSVVGPSMSAFRYFFDIQQVMPRFRNPLANDWARVRIQIHVTAPFYAGIAYSFGALAWKHRLLPTLFGFEEHAEPATRPDNKTT